MDTFGHLGKKLLGFVRNAKALIGTKREVNLPEKEIKNMPIMVGENYKIEAMKLNIVLYRKTDSESAASLRLKQAWKDRKSKETEDCLDDEKNEDDKDGWAVEGYFATINAAFRSILHLEIEKSDLKDVQTVVDRINAVEAMINNIDFNTVTLSKSGIDG